MFQSTTYAKKSLKREKVNKEEHEKFLVRLRAMLRTGGFLGVHSSITASLGQRSVAWEKRSINKVPETRGRLPKLAQREWLSCGCKQWLEAGRELRPRGVCLETHPALAASHFLAPSSLYDSNCRCSSRILQVLCLYYLSANHSLVLPL